MTAIQVCKQRFYSGEYYWRNPEFEKLGKPVIINIRTTQGRRKREEAEQDMVWLKESLPKLGFDDPYILDDEVDDKLHDRKYLMDKLMEIANDDRMTKKADVFLCIVMAYGVSNYIQLAKNKTSVPEKGQDRVDIKDIIDVFKADNCPGLICKPKIFIIHTEDTTLEIITPEKLGKQRMEKVEAKVPVEADLMIYHSEMSARYTRYIAGNKPKKYVVLMKRDLVEELEACQKLNSDNEDEGSEDDQTPKSSSPQDKQGEDQDISDEEESYDEDDSDDDDETDLCQFKTTGTHFIFTLCKVADELVKENRFDINRWVFLTNNKLTEFIKTSYWKPLSKDGIWNKKPRIPICTIQLTKKLAIDI